MNLWIFFISGFCWIYTFCSASLSSGQDSYCWLPLHQIMAKCLIKIVKLWELKNFFHVCTGWNFQARLIQKLYCPIMARQKKLKIWTELGQLWNLIIYPGPGSTHIKTLLAWPCVKAKSSTFPSLFYYLKIQTNSVST